MGENNVLKKQEARELLSSLDDSEVIEREVSISWDKRNLLVRIPKEICGYLGLNEKNRFEKNILFSIVEKDKKVVKTFDVVDRSTPKKKHGNKKTK